ncbi:hypothetical protein ACJ65_08210 [Kocuria rhizophila]|nr:hypothetical protein ACJ65_08210 [Kocuria rhizophila]
MRSHFRFSRGARGGSRVGIGGLRLSTRTGRAVPLQGSEVPQAGPNPRARRRRTAGVPAHRTVPRGPPRRLRPSLAACPRNRAPRRAESSRGPGRLRR